MAIICSNIFKVSPFNLKNQNYNTYLTIRVGQFSQKHASYCGNLGMTHKDEK